MTTPILGMDEMVQAQQNPYIIFNEAIRALEAAIFDSDSGGGGGVAEPAPVVTESTTSLAATAANAGNYTRFTNASAKTYSFDSGESYTVGDEYHGRNAGAGALMIEGDSGFTINPPFGGSLVVPEGGTFTVKIVAADEADLFGITEVAS